MHQPLFHLRSTLQIIATLTLITLQTACDGTASVSFDRAIEETTINENNKTGFWTSPSLQVQGGKLSDVTYKLGGPDGKLFTITATHLGGTIAFAQAADFESPQDDNKDNEYIIEIEARLKESTAVQTVRIKVTNETHPELKIVKPLPNENVGKGDKINVQSLVEFYDDESNTPINGADLTLNGQPFTQLTTNTAQWAGSVDVPEGGITAEFTGTTEDGVSIKQTTQFFNKRNALNPFLMGVSRDNSLFVYDPVNHKIAEVDLSTNNWGVYFSDPRLNQTQFLLDFNPKDQTIYFFIDPKTFTDGDFLMSLNFASNPTIKYGGIIPGALGITWDKRNNSVNVLTKTEKNGKPACDILSVHGQDGFFNSLPLTKKTKLVGVIECSEIAGLRQFTHSGASDSFLFVTERDQAGKKTINVSPSFLSTGEPVEIVGADLSNIVIDEKKSVGYAITNPEGNPSGAQLITFEMTEGIIESWDYSPLKMNNNVPGAISDIRLDSANNIIYVGDTVRDSIFTIDLETRMMRELPLQFDPNRSAVISPGADN
ncbi:MAG: hypothetical protein RL497_2001 [Pseudomonadota bacterium]|jgi:hypothetical protein